MNGRQVTLPAEAVLKAVLESPTVLEMLREDLLSGLALLTVPQARKVLGLGEDAWKSLRPRVKEVTVGAQKRVRLSDLRAAVAALGAAEGVSPAAVPMALAFAKRKRRAGAVVGKGMDGMD